MTRHRHWNLLFAVLAVCLAASAAGCSGSQPKAETKQEQKTQTPGQTAQKYPVKPIELVLPVSAGGSFDLTARCVASVSQEHIGAPIVITLAPGGGTVPGTASVVQASPDGYKLLGGGEHTVVLKHFQDIPVNVLDNLIPVCQVAEWPWILAVPADRPWKTLQELIAHAKQNPQGVTIGNSGALAVGHMPALILEDLAGIKVTHVPFDGGGPVALAAASGEVDAAFDPPPPFISLIQDGKIRPLAITGEKRWPGLPDVPTFAELGYPINVSLTWGIFAPKGTPKEIVDYLEAKFKEICEDKSYNQLIKKMGDFPSYKTGAEFEKYLRTVDAEIKKVAERLKQSK